MGLFSSKGDKKSKDTAVGSMSAMLSDGQEHALSNRVDCLGDSCPRPQLMTKKAIASAAPGDLLEIQVDNPTSMEALPPMCPGLSATHVETLSDDSGWRVYIRKN